MRFWIRELAGWLLVLAGLWIFYKCYYFLFLASDPAAPRLLEAGPLTLIGIVVFRGGIHLLKVAAAADVCLRAAQPGPDLHRPRPGARAQMYS